MAYFTPTLSPALPCTSLQSYRAKCRCAVFLHNLPQRTVAYIPFLLPLLPVFSPCWFTTHTQAVLWPPSCRYVRDDRLCCTVCVAFASSHSRASHPHLSYPRAPPTNPTNRHADQNACHGRRRHDAEGQHAAGSGRHVKTFRMSSTSSSTHVTTALEYCVSHSRPHVIPLEESK